MKSQQQRQVLRILLLVIVAVTSSSAFSIASSPAGRCHVGQARTTTTLSLHPSQASDLEACANAMLKEASKSAAQHQDGVIAMNSPVSSRRPMFWIRRIVWPFGQPTASELRP